MFVDVISIVPVIAAIAAGEANCCRDHQHAGGEFVNRHLRYLPKDSLRLPGHHRTANAYIDVGRETA